MHSYFKTKIYQFTYIMILYSIVWCNFAKVMSLKQAIEDQWSYKSPCDFSSYDLAALGHVLCVFNKSHIAAIKPTAYK